MQAVTEFDIITGFDVHITLVPAPPSPTPVPMPNIHPFVGVVFNPLDWIPFFNKVRVNGFPAASVSSGGSPIPPLHIPTPPGIPGMWAKGKVGDDAMMMMGGLTVSANGKAMTYNGLMVLSCSCIGSPPLKPPDPKKMTAKQKLAVALGYLPTSFVTAIPKGKPVIIGCPPTIDIMALAFAFAMKAALTLGGHFFRAWQRNSPRWAQFSNWLSRKTGNRNWLNRAICWLTGHPVDIATGKVFTDHTDFEIPGPIPLKWERVWFSTSVYEGPLGHGWHHSYDWALRYDPDEKCLFIRMNDGREIEFPELPLGEDAYNRQEKMLLQREADHYVLRNAEGLRYRFQVPPDRSGTQQKLLSVENAAGFAIRLVYDKGGDLNQITDSASRIFQIKSDSRGRIISIEVPHPEKIGETFSIVSYCYDDRNNLKQAADALQQPFTYVYNRHLLVQETNRNGLSFYFEYDGPDENAWCVRTWGDEGIYDHKLTYNKEDKWTIVENSLGHKTKYFWNDFGTVFKTVDPAGNEKLFRYGDFMQVLSETDELGQVTFYDYDNWGNKIRTTFPDGSKLEHQYDGHLLVATVDPNGGKWQWEYNVQELIIARKDPLGITTQYEYENGLVNTILEPAGGRIQIEYDNHCNISTLIAPNGAINQWKFDRLGRCILSTDPNGNARKRKFNLNGWVRQVKEPDGNIREIEYDGEGNVLHAKDNHNDIRFEYGGMNRVRARVEAGTRVEFKYNTEDDLLGIINEHGYAYRFELDARQQVIQESGFDGLVRRYRRDAAGRVLEISRPGNKATRYEYDALGRVTGVDYSDGSMEKFAYRPDGVLIEASNEHTTVKFERNALGQVVKETQGDYSVASEYDLSGTRIQLISSLGAKQIFRRNIMGDVEAVTSHEAETSWETTFKRDNLGLEMERALPGGVRSEWKRDRLGRPVEHNTFATGGGKPSRSRKYVWDVNDRLKQIIDPQKGTWNFEHDALGNLSAAQYPDGAFEFRMPDAVGNLFRSKDPKDRKYGPAGQLLEAGGTRYEYDEEGNLIRKVQPGGAVWRYEWNAAGMLARVIRPDGGTVSFTYDALGRRISKTYRNRTTRWIWDGNVPLHEWVEVGRQSAVGSLQAAGGERSGLIKIKKRDTQLATAPANAPPVSSWTEHELLTAEGRSPTADRPLPTEVTTWLFEPESFAPLAKLRDGQHYGIVTDHLGTPAAMYDRSGEKVWETDLSIYGEVRTLQGWRESCPFRYPGQYEDVETGLYYNRFRYYDAEGGVYVSQDPIGLIGGFSLYSFIHDPNSWVDLFGLSASCPPTSSLSDEDFLRRIAQRAERWGVRKGFGAAGTGPLQGTAKHGYAEALIRRYQRMTGQRTHLEIESSYLGGSSVPRGTAGSARPDVYNPSTGEVFDFKFTRDSSSPIRPSQQANNAANLPSTTSQTAIHP